MLCRFFKLVSVKRIKKTYSRNMHSWLLRYCACFSASALHERLSLPWMNIHCITATIPFCLSIWNPFAYSSVTMSYPQIRFYDQGFLSSVNKTVVWTPGQGWESKPIEHRFWYDCYLLVLIALQTSEPHFSIIYISEPWFELITSGALEQMLPAT